MDEFKALIGKVATGAALTREEAASAFGVMMSGGGKVLGWLASKGLKGPSAIAHAVSRLRKG